MRAIDNDDSLLSDGFWQFVLWHSSGLVWPIHEKLSHRKDWLVETNNSLPLGFIQVDAWWRVNDSWHKITNNEYETWHAWLNHKVPGQYPDTLETDGEPPFIGVPAHPAVDAYSLSIGSSVPPHKCSLHLKHIGIASQNSFFSFLKKKGNSRAQEKKNQNTIFSRMVLLQKTVLC